MTHDSRDSHSEGDKSQTVERVPVCGTPGVTVSRAIWDEAWIAYAKEYGMRGDDRQHARLLREGFYAGELDELRPGWRPVEQRIAQLESVIAQHNLCHDLHGKVDCEDFAKGCAAEITRIYGRCPWQEEIDRLRTTEHLAWHLCESSEEDAQTGTITVDRDDFDALAAALPETHPTGNIEGKS